MNNRHNKERYGKIALIGTDTCCTPAIELHAANKVGESGKVIGIDMTDRC